MISCKVSTYGRVSFLEEAIESFLRQEFEGKKELVIINDYPLQELVYNHPEIRIINIDMTYPLISQKENFAVSQCKGDIIATFDDDDIAMPWHLSNIAKYIEDNDLIRWGNGVYYNEPKITSITYIGNSGMVYRKQAWEKIGGFPLENAGYDSTFTDIMVKQGKVKKVMVEKPSWFYRWGTIPSVENGNMGIYHQSGQGYDKEGKPNIIQRHSMYIEQQRAMGKIPTGTIHLKPHWNKDYQKMLEDDVAVKSNNTSL
jgi:glycosyltransferase involved in cell wall biosynthesis